MTDLEETAIAFFRAIRATGREVLGHDQFGFKIDINTMSPPDGDKEKALLFGNTIQQALTLASRTVQPIVVEGTTLQ